MARQQMVAMHRADDDAASSHHSAEGNGGTGRDDHFALMNLGDQVGQQAPLSNEAMPVAKRRGRKDCRDDERRRGTESAGATASMASAIGLLNREKAGKFLLVRALRRVSQFSNEQTPLFHSICGNIKSRLVNVSRDRSLVVA
jgi:hypothetical protein